MIRRFRLFPAGNHGRGRQKTPLNTTSLESHATLYQYSVRFRSAREPTRWRKKLQLVREVSEDH